VWDDVAPEVEEITEATTPVAPTPKETKSKLSKPTTKVVEENTEPLFDLEGLMTDFPTAKELEKFVYDQTGWVLNLKGRSNKFKYQTAMDVLNGEQPDEAIMGSENPYLDKADMVPEDKPKAVPERSPELESAGPEVNVFDTNLFPHPDPEWKSQDMKCQVRFCKYANGAISYEILGPVAKRAIGVRINKFGKEVPEKYVWVDPRTGEQLIRRGDGSYTPLGTKLRAFMKRQRMNSSNQWDVWIDRDFVVADTLINDNPWDVQ
jgi:hypothetical protein